MCLLWSAVVLLLVVRLIVEGAEEAAEIKKRVQLSIRAENAAKAELLIGRTPSQVAHRAKGMHHA